MSILLSVPILLFLLILQTTIVSEVRLFHGAADLILVWLAAWGVNQQGLLRLPVGFLCRWTCVVCVSAAWYVYPSAYLVTVALAHYVSKQLWQSPLISMFAITLVASIMLYLISMAGLRLNGTIYSWQISLTNVIIPSVLLNLLMAIPVYALCRDLAGWVFRNEEVE